MTKSELQIKPCKRIKRIIASTIDTILALAFFGIISAPLVLVFINNISTPTPSTSIGLVLISMLTGALISLVAMTYEILLPFIWYGQTVGMRLMRIKIVDEKGDELKLRQLIIRAISLVFTFITTAGVSLLSEIFIVALSSDHRSFHDCVSRIYVVDYVKNPKSIRKNKEDE